MRPNVSIIIPTYNAEAFLVQCLDSVVQQTQQSIEIVIINDASKDSSLDIIKSYQAQDPRITLIDFKENKGNGYGRNFGIKQAQGEYILFLDSDDWLEPDAVEQVYHKALQNQSQVVVFGYTQHMTAIKNKRKNKEIFLPTEQFVLDLLNVLKSKLTIIFISHRLHALPKIADTIYVIENGEIGAFGTHSSLMQTTNFYSSFWKTLQL
ncbi:glycosyltransferase [Flavobacteriaceae bacterium]|nr:glycosyltransferase [Flavobacteriaceae bacterium]